MTKRSVYTLLAIAVLGLAGFLSVFTLHEREQAILLEFGKPRDEVREAGLHFKPPWWSVERLDKRVLNLDIDPEEVTASDQKRLEVDAFARFRVLRPLETFKTVGTVGVARDQIEKLLTSSIREVLGLQELETLLSDQRAALMAEIRDRVNRAAESYGIEIVDVRIKRADLPEANTEAILRRMETERKRDAQLARSEGQRQALEIRARAERERTVILAEAERDSQKIRGAGDSEAVRIFADAFGRDEDFFEFYCTMQAYRTALRQDDTTLILSPDSEFFDYFGGLDRQGR